MKILHTFSFFEIEDKNNVPKPEYTGTMRRNQALREIKEMMKDTLTLRQLQITELYYIDGLNTPQIAKKLGINKSTASRAINRSLKKLSPYLKYYRLR
ncbi:MAG: helix-turn-helix domain-containing protein [Oscillospiraceae bacterium]|nr:helix-turn-helix domain-containing protein [Oscillospiraceae bacterium]